MRIPVYNRQYVGGSVSGYREQGAASSDAFGVQVNLNPIFQGMEHVASALDVIQDRKDRTVALEASNRYHEDVSSWIKDNENGLMAQGRSGVGLTEAFGKYSDDLSRKLMKDMSGTQRRYFENSREGDLRSFRRSVSEYEANASLMNFERQKQARMNQEVKEVLDDFGNFQSFVPRVSQMLGGIDAAYSHLEPEKRDEEKRKVVNSFIFEGFERLINSDANVENMPFLLEQYTKRFGVDEATYGVIKAKINKRRRDDISRRFVQGLWEAAGKGPGAVERMEEFHRTAMGDEPDGRVMKFFGNTWEDLNRSLGVPFANGEVMSSDKKSVRLLGEVYRGGLSISDEAKRVGDAVLEGLPDGSKDEVWNRVKEMASLEGWGVSKRIEVMSYCFGRMKPVGKEAQEVVDKVGTGLGAYLKDDLRGAGDYALRSWLETADDRYVEGYERYLDGVSGREAEVERVRFSLLANFGKSVDLIGDLFLREDGPELSDVQREGLLAAIESAGDMPSSVEWDELKADVAGLAVRGYRDMQYGEAGVTGGDGVEGGSGLFRGLDRTRREQLLEQVKFEHNIKERSWKVQNRKAVEGLVKEVEDVWKSGAADAGRRIAALMERAKETMEPRHFAFAQKLVDEVVEFDRSTRSKAFFEVSQVLALPDGELRRRFPSAFDLGLEHGKDLSKEDWEMVKGRYESMDKGVLVIGEDDAALGAIRAFVVENGLDMSSGKGLADDYVRNVSEFAAVNGSEGLKDYKMLLNSMLGMIISEAKRSRGL